MMLKRDLKMNKMEEITIKCRNLYNELSPNLQQEMLRSITHHKLKEMLPSKRGSAFENINRVYAISTLYFKANYSNGSKP